ncbi:WD repeat-containing protein on Y chromosome [Drosophila sechellia]|uniref:GM26717 n=1 Tax=Drosophila sechellia TaxID=7238 RepID=B4IE57_DROSE|nr:WD repeat-containing protein on Y chromosome [Drosophila sechellia]EDW45884.1 GM26717 [Drosophila sechellia]
MDSSFNSDQLDTDRNGLQNLLARSLKEPILGKHFALPGRIGQSPPIELDTSQSYIAVYTHLKVHATRMPERLPTPEAIGRIQAENLEAAPKTRSSKTRLDPCSNIN